MARERTAHARFVPALLCILGTLAIVLSLGLRHSSAQQLVQDYFCNPGSGCATCGPYNYTCGNVLLPNGYS